MSKHDIEAIYPLSPLQQGILFHSVLEDGHDPYVLQLSYRMEGLYPAAFRRAWERTTERHAVLRSAFLWERNDRPLQVVHRRVEPTAWEEADWRGLSPEERELALLDFLAAERARGFAFKKAPLMRFGLFRLGEDEYQWAWSYHHLLMDGWSVQTVLRDVFACYEAELRGESPRWGAPPAYAGYVAWLQKQDAAAAEGFWREALRGFEAPTPLEPARAADGAAASHEEMEVRIPRELTSALHAFARERQVTLNTAVQGAWALVLSRWSGEDDVVFGGTVSGRPPELDGVEGMVGLFINTLPVRVRIPGREPVTAWLRRLQDEQATARQYDYTPLVQVQGWSEVPRGTPLFESLLVFENYPLSAAAEERRKAGVQVRSVRSVERTGYPLALLVLPTGGMELHLCAQYDAARFPREVVERLVGHFERALDAMVRHPEEPLAALELLAPDERLRLLAERNDTARGRPAGTTLHGLVEAQARRTPDAVAVVCEGEMLTYAELDARAERLARRLRAHGVGPETRVGVCMERSPEMVVSLLAVLRAGGAYVPMDPSYPAERLDHMLADSGVRVLLARGPLPAGLAVDGVRVLDAGDAPADGAEPAWSGADPGNLAYVIYTSGSTGRPKGAMNEHRGIVNRLLWMQEEYGLGAGDAVLQKTPFSFDVSVWEFFWPLMTGARLVLARPEGHRDPAYLCELIERERVTTLHFVPSMLGAFLDEVGAGGERCGSLRRVVCSGEALPAELAERCLARLPGVELHNLYGPTEAAVDVTSWRCRRGAGRVPIGRPVANTRVYVLDRGLDPVPDGAAGELYLGGVQVGRGYLGRPGLTAERFVPDAFSGEAGARLYRTGDRVRWGADGALEYLGRLDHQVKVRGFRIELGEIEATLLRHPGVREAAVVVREDAPGDLRLVGYFVAEGEAPRAAELRAALRERLPEHMVPPELVPLERLPLTPNGKLDRAALPDPRVGRLPVDGAQAAPLTPTEEVLAGIWELVLRVEGVRAEESFFELGGHSLLAMRVVARVREVFGVEMPLRAIFEAPVLRDLAAWVDAARREGGHAAAAPMRRAPRDGALPLSFGQQRLWFLDQLYPGGWADNAPVALRMTGTLDVTALERVLGEIVRRHEVLRTVFGVVDGVPVQEVLPPEPFRLAVEDLTGLPEEAREPEMLERALAEARRPFDLARGPLLRARLLRLAGDRHVFLLTMHHIVTDGWSTGIFFRELKTLYAAFVRGEPSPLPEPTLQYADFAVWQREHLQGEVLDRQIAFWREKLTGAPPVLELPTDHPRPPVQSYRGASVTRTIPAGVSRELVALGRREGATPFMVLLAAWQLLLARYSGQDDVSVGTPVGGRTRAEVEEMIGLFINTLVLRTDLAGDPTFRELLARVRETTLGAYAHQDVPFERLVEELQPQRSLTHGPLFQALLVFQNTPGEGLQLPGLRLQGINNEVGFARVDLNLYAEEHGDTLHLTLRYASDLFEAETAGRMLEQLGVLLEGIAREPGARTSALELLPPAERRLVVEEWNATARPYDRAGLIHQLFEAQAARTPHALAVVAGAERLTYAELNRRSNRLAHLLRSVGVRRGSHVAVYLERGAEMVVAVLGVLKAGGLYVPLETSYPEARVQWILDRLGAACILTQRPLLDAVRGIGEGAPSLRHAVCLDADPVPAEGSGPVRAWGPADLAAHSDTDPAPLAGADDLAYVIFTSGSTGTPKGVMVQHRPVVNLVEWLTRDFGVDAADRVLFVTSLCFDLSVYDIFGLLAVGGSIQVVPSADVRDPERLLELLCDPEVTFWDSAPAALQQLAPLFPQVRERAARSGLRRVFLSGDWIPVSLPDAVRDVFPRARVVALGGATEATVWSNYHRVETVDPSWPSIPYGRPMPNAQYYVLDTSLQPAPIGVPGDLYIGGECLCLGYAAEPGLTADRFVPDPLGGSPGARLYRTGDRARWHACGELEFLGRLDHQVKVRGFRIELGEIESVLRQHEEVREAVVLARQDAPGDRTLVAYVVPAGDVAPSVSELRAVLRERLPEYMVPSAFVVLDRLPATANGKLDRKALPAPDAVRADAGAAYEPPVTETELTLAEIWCQVLRRDRVGLNDDFFDLGGHSLLVTQVMSKVRARFRVEIPLRVLFEAVTLGALAARIDQAVGDVDAEMLALIQHLSEDEVRALLAAEEAALQGDHPHA